MPIIRQLEPHIINQIAAGEVVERPASVIKELVENALDAGAQNLHIAWRQGGQSFISVEDDGCGMKREDMELAIQRHTTSKLEDLSSISTFGFRGEALAAIASISRFRLVSGLGLDTGWALSVEAGQVQSMQPTPQGQGSLIEVRDLFFSTPARLKFMRSSGTEHLNIMRVIEKIALAYPNVGLSISYDHKKKLYPLGLVERLNMCLGADFMANAFQIEAQREGYGLKGYVGLPTYNRANAEGQFFFVNGRGIRDKTFSSCLRAALADVMPQGRYGVCVLFLTLPFEDVDVNVHPAKTEVRFKDMLFLRQFLLTSLKQHLLLHGQKSASYAVPVAPVNIDPPELTGALPQCLPTAPSYALFKPALSFAARSYDMPSALSLQENIHYVAPALELKSTPDMGKAIGQIHQRYIVACNSQGLLIVDPHAAQERIVYEHMKRQWDAQPDMIQPFLLSIPVALSASQIALYQQHHKTLAQLGFAAEVDSAYLHLQSIPFIFQYHDPVALIKDLLSILSESEQSAQDIITSWRNHMLANWACRQSLKLGQALSLHEMDALLRTIEKTANSAQCNHGRPVYRQFSMAQMDAMFQR